MEFSNNQHESELNVTQPGGSNSVRSRYLRSRRAGDHPIATLRDRIGNSKLIAKGKTLLPSWHQDHSQFDGSTAFIPCPKITFLVDRPASLTCQICCDSRFKLRQAPQGKKVDDSTFSILPCAHVAGTECLAEWLKSDENSHCPFCRFDLRYPGCKHMILPRTITQDSIHTLPQTIPEGGTIPNLCSECFKNSLHEAAVKQHAVAVEQFRAARRRVQRTGAKADETEFLRAKDEVETLLRDKVHIPYLQTVLSVW